ARSCCNGRSVMEAGAPFSAAYPYRRAGIRRAGHYLAKDQYISGYWQPLDIRGLVSLVLNVVDVCWRYPACPTPGDIFGSHSNRTNKRRNDGFSVEGLHQGLPPPTDATPALPPPTPRSPHRHPRGRGVDSSLGAGTCHRSQRDHDRSVRCRQDGWTAVVVSVQASD